MGGICRWWWCLTGIVAGMLLVLAGCQCGGAALPGGLPADAAAVIEDYAAGWEQRDAAAIRANFADGCPGLPAPDFYHEIFSEVTAVTIIPDVTAAMAEGADTWRVQVSERRTLQFTGGDSLTVAVPVTFTLVRTAAGWKIAGLRDPA